MLIVDIIKAALSAARMKYERNCGFSARINEWHTRCLKLELGWRVCNNIAPLKVLARIATKRLSACTNLTKTVKWIIIVNDCFFTERLNRFLLASKMDFYSPTLWFCVNSFEMNCISFIYCRLFSSITYTQKCLSLNNVTKIHQKISDSLTSFSLSPFALQQWTFSPCPEKTTKRKQR